MRKTSVNERLIYPHAGTVCVDWRGADIQ